jgi:hypothetical protein
LPRFALATANCINFDSLAIDRQKDFGLTIAPRAAPDPAIAPMDNRGVAAIGPRALAMRANQPGHETGRHGPRVARFQPDALKAAKLPHPASAFRAAAAQWTERQAHLLCDNASLEDARSVARR